jgi:DUF1009 family protein
VSKREKIGIVAGSGELPLMVVEFCKKNDVDVCCVLVKPFAERENFQGIENREFSLGRVGKVIKYFRANGVVSVVFAGGVKKPSFASLSCDFTGFLLLKQILKQKILGDNTVLETVIKFFEGKGFVIDNVNKYISDGKFIRGFNGKIICKDPDFLENIELGKKTLERLSDLDIGQSIIVQQKNIIGIECVEGTQKLIERSKELIYNQGGGAFLLKIKKIRQNDKVDLPSIGKDTILQLKGSGLAGLVADYKNCLVMRREEIIRLADENGLFIYGISTHLE